MNGKFVCTSLMAVCCSEFGPVGGTKNGQTRDQSNRRCSVVAAAIIICPA